jgi:hypothetical protein
MARVIGVSGALKQNSWEFRSVEDIQRFWAEVQIVPMRAEGRKHPHEEQWAVGLYLLLLGRHGLLSYPFRLDEGESPDFMLTWLSGETSGLEVTRATTASFQQVMTKLDREFIRRERAVSAKEGKPEPVVFVDWNLPDEAARVRTWCNQVLEAIQRKLDKLANFRKATYHDLLVCNDADVPLFRGREKTQAFDTVASEFTEFEARFQQSFRSVSVIMSTDVEYDIGRNRRLLVYRESEAS